MAATQLILNGDFSDSTNTSAVSWTGTDIETRESDVYLAGTTAEYGRVAEMNGGQGQVTVVQQTFTVDAAHTGSLSFDFALRSSNGGATANVDGFRVEILDSSGNVLFKQNIYPTEAAYQTFTTSVEFPSDGDYTIRFTELGDNADGLGAVLDNVSLLVCFTGSTGIATPNGSVRACDLAIGDLVTTANGPKPIRWIARRHVSAADIKANALYAPVCIRQDALGSGLPHKDLWLSRQHRLLASSNVVQRMFGVTDVLLPSIRLTCLNGIYVDTTVADFDYIHILLDDHEVLYAEGAPAESMLLGQMALDSLTPAAIDELKLIFPDVMEANISVRSACHIPDAARQKKLVERLKKNDRPVLESYTTS
ncbi:Hint domain-containing protein [Albirhodobacter sp. R86504]|uniref:Hint domain-containing protein n=1 Tax=Albirhodobacter sp. R86504 TaxID=3093848 RepID=UPI0036707082